MKEIIKTDKAPAALGPHSQGCKAGGYIFVSGQGARNPETGKIESDTIQGQTRQTLENMKGILEAGGASMEDVVKVTVLLIDVSDYKGMNEVFKTYFLEGEDPPARITAGASLPLPGGLVEMDCIAYVGT